MSPTHCPRCRRRTCRRDGTCERRYRRSGKGRLCEGPGHVGGPAFFKHCAVCRVSKANTAYWNGSDICTSCRNASVLCVKCNRRKAEDGRAGALCSTCRKGHDFRITQYAQDIKDRVSFEEHMAGHHATAADFAAVHQALDRYGLKNPTADEVIGAYVATGSGMTHGQLFHAVVLAANEAMKPGTRTMRKRMNQRTIRAASTDSRTSLHGQAAA